MDINYELMANFPGEIEPTHLGIWLGKDGTPLTEQEVIAAARQNILDIMNQTHDESRLPENYYVAGYGKAMQNVTRCFTPQEIVQDQIAALPVLNPDNTRYVTAIIAEHAGGSGTYPVEVSRVYSFDEFYRLDLNADDLVDTVRNTYQDHSPEDLEKYDRVNQISVYAFTLEPGDQLNPETTEIYRGRTGETLNLYKNAVRLSRDCLLQGTLENLLNPDYEKTYVLFQKEDGKAEEFPIKEWAVSDIHQRPPQEEIDQAIRQYILNTNTGPNTYFVMRSRTKDFNSSYLDFGQEVPQGKTYGNHSRETLSDNFFYTEEFSVSKKNFQRNYQGKHPQKSIMDFVKEHQNPDWNRESSGSRFAEVMNHSRHPVDKVVSAKKQEETQNKKDREESLRWDNGQPIL